MKQRIERFFLLLILVGVGGPPSVRAMDGARWQSPSGGHWALLGVTSAAALWGQFGMSKPSHAKWAGGIGPDEAVKDLFRAESSNTRSFARGFTDVGVGSSFVLPFIMTTDREKAGRIAFINLQAIATTAVLTNLSKNGVAVNGLTPLGVWQASLKTLKSIRTVGIPTLGRAFGVGIPHLLLLELRWSVCIRVV